MSRNSTYRLVLFRLRGTKSVNSSLGRNSVSDAYQCQVGDVILHGYIRNEGAYEIVRTDEPRRAIQKQASNLGITEKPVQKRYYFMADLIFDVAEIVCAGFLARGIHGVERDV